MCLTARHRLVAVMLFLLVVAEAVAQQAAPQQAVQQQPVEQVPAAFKLNTLQEAELNQVLDAWQHASAKIASFQCSFQRWEYDVAFGPKDKTIPLNKNLGELSYQKPDKGSFQIKEIHTFRQDPVPPGQQPPAVQTGNWVLQPDAIGEHWVCDGKSVYEYRHDQKQLVERPIPPQLQGQAIVDGPLPFLFGAEATTLKRRYWMKLDERNNDPKQVWLIAQPKFREQAADFTEVDVILDRQLLLPLYMQVWMPNGSHHMYIFDMANADINGLFNRVKAALFTRPSVPAGWKRVVENIPLQQAEKPTQPPR